MNDNFLDAYADTARRTGTVVYGAFIAIEDRRFRSHFGIDPIGLTRAAFQNGSVHGST